MDSNSAHKIRLWSEIALSVISLVCGVLFITQVADVYYSHVPSNGDMYSRAIVWGRLKYLLIPLCIWLIGVIACFVLSVIYPSAKAAAQKPSAADRAARLRKKLPKALNAEYDSEHKTLVGYELGRYIIYGVGCGLGIAAAVIAMVYIFDITNFRSGVINTDILNMVKHVLPWVAASFLCFVGAAVYEYVTAERELQSITKLLVMCKGVPITLSPLAQRLERVKKLISDNEAAIVWGVRLAVLIAAAVFIGLGAANGGAADVLNKAVNICTECIGLG